MTDSIVIDSNVKRLLVNDDPNRVITFDPTDMAFVSKFYELIKELELKQVDYEVRVQSIANGNGSDNIKEKIDLIKEVCEYMRGKIDLVFGIGTSQAAFGNSLDIDAFEQFFTGITPYIRTVRASKINQYRSRPIASAARKKKASKKHS